MKLKIKNEKLIMPVSIFLCQMKYLPLRESTSMYSGMLSCIHARYGKYLTWLILLYCLVFVFLIGGVVDAYAAQSLVVPKPKELVIGDNKISLNFRDIEVRDLLQFLAEFAHKNIVVGDGVEGNITINLEKVAWRDALALILKEKHLAMNEKDGVIFVTGDFAGSAVLESALFQAHYAKAPDLALLLTKGNSFLSKDGAAVPDARTNSIWIKDYAPKVQEMLKYLREVDIPVKQIMIEARIVYADDNFVRELGLKFGSNSSDKKQAVGDMSMDLPLKIDPGHATFALAKLGGGVLLDLELSALETEGRGKVISSPKLMTLNRESAYIEAGDEIPYQEKTSAGNTSVVFKKAVLGLKVTPEIATQNKINLRLQLNQDKVSTTNVNGVPAIQTREIQTQVLVNDGQTLVLGGIYEESAGHILTKIPFLSAIPILGLLFQHKETSVEHKELLIFVTPRVV